MKRTRTLFTVARCVARHDGGWMLVLREGGAAVSLSPVAEGSRVTVMDGKAEVAK